ncbi:P-loop containing nucleoside triphosphate hydrolase protein [Dothidotthia symphoricarpi CBS 119687]|uniref:P-loop containing nucleoside triphosphate hydrolase protein n=1 Tax=Dothidotthia symphoricarpi CBS 119687 TaxID=1392245 RepID=A0A6A5ZVF1_9PLEO|nr:P-loop containing nucleoside triphosphate hydrolase protein [Dothidotthia symphoricarpi CBS 119687]KAF2123702.1 P-loop containing nucleoside triphosphate hydrolase protein [Dothidotthia symphoricarpi CBS 119687]
MAPLPTTSYITLAEAQSIIRQHDIDRQKELHTIQSDHGQQYNEAKTHIRDLENELKVRLIAVEEYEFQLEQKVAKDQNELLRREVTVFKNPIQRFLRVRRSIVGPTQDHSGFKCNLMRLQFEGTDEYSFDRIFDSAAEQHSNANIYSRLRVQLGRAKEGNHVVIIAYGPSGAGKTSTLYDGTSQRDGTHDMSLLYRIVQELLQNLAVGWKLRMSWLEAHHDIAKGKDTLFNLLVDPKQKVTHKTHSSSNAPSENCFMYSTANDYFVTDAREFLEPVDIVSQKKLEVMKEKARRNRSTDATDMNKQSSRASTFVELRLELHGELQGVITIVDTMGQESSTNKSQKQRVAAGAGMATNSELSDMLRALGQQHTVKGRQGACKVTQPVYTTHRFRRSLQTSLTMYQLNKLLFPAFNRSVLKGEHHCHVTVIGHVFDQSDRKHTRETLETLKLWETHAKANERER